jgi:8-oxo-dGTP pyrophosphatase MutT (NUDIX family)
MHMAPFTDFILKLRQKLAGPLPGLSSQIKMASVRRIIEGNRMKIPEDVKKGGVLVLFYPYNDKIHLVFMKRTEYPGVHSGQISFAGGAWEPEDNDMEMTALREAEEEIGVKRNLVTLIGRLSELFIPPSNFLVTPVVGYTLSRPDFKPDPVEVDKILEIPLDHLIKAETRQIKDISVYPDVKMQVPCFYAESEVIWGATAMILNELIDLISQES